MSSLSLLENISLADIRAERLHRKRNRFEGWFPETGPYRAELYPKHWEFINAGAQSRERAFIAANRTGKTETGAYEATCHATGNYPARWQGKRFTRPTVGWAAGDTNKTVREILQEKLLGKFGDFGTGMLPYDSIHHTTPKSGVPESVDTIYVKHVSGGLSKIVLKSYQEGRESFQGTAIDWGWLDEECPPAIYTETLLRTMTTEGIIFLTFTPLQGLSEVVMMFLPSGSFDDLPQDQSGSRYVVHATWDDVPHLTEKAKAELLAALPPFQRDARSKGVPQLGAGVIYPVPEEDIVVTPFQIPNHWPRGYGMDVGWNWTAVVWNAWDRETDTVYLYDEYLRGDVEPAVHAQAVKARGEWIPGVIDPAANGRSQVDGQKLLDLYRKLGLNNLTTAVNAVEAGIYDVWSRMSSGRFKAFRSCSKYLEERRLYRRDEKGKIVKTKDHLQDAERYRIHTGLESMIVKPAQKPVAPPSNFGGGGRGWMS